MRVTQVLCFTRRQFWFQNIWKKKHKAVITKTIVPPELQTATSKPIIDPLQELYETERTKVWIPPDDPRFMFPPRPEDRPDWHSEPAYTLDSSIKLWEGLRQALVLTNCVLQQGLPEQVLEKAKRFSSPAQDHLMQRIILQSHLWDTTRVKLPKQRNTTTSKIWKYKSEFGIPTERITDLMLKGITQKCFQLLGTTQPSLVSERRLITDHKMNSHLEFEDQNVYVTSNSHSLLTSNQPLPRFASKEQVLDTKDSTIGNLWPVSPLVDLEKSHCYKTEGDLGYTAGYRFPHHHTLFLVHDKDWTMSMRHANALLMSYAHCLQLAQHHNLTQSLLSEPVCVQTVHTDGVFFGYTCFQLNTTSSFKDDKNRGYGSRHNMAWVDDDALFIKSLSKRGMLRNTKYSQYNPHVFQKILGLFAR